MNIFGRLRARYASDAAHLAEVGNAYKITVGKRLTGSCRFGWGNIITMDVS